MRKLYVIDANASADRVKQCGSFHLDLPPAEAIKLFTAAGERLWVPGWNPVILEALPQQAGLVFTTGEGPDHTIWTVIDNDAAMGRIRYSRVTPASRAGIVTVEVKQAGAGSLVTVGYDLTALSPDGAVSLGVYAPGPFAQMMINWKRLIDDMSTEARTGLTALVA